MTKTAQVELKRGRVPAPGPYLKRDFRSHGVEANVENESITRKQSITCYFQALKPGAL